MRIFDLYVKTKIIERRGYITAHGTPPYPQPDNQIARTDHILGYGVHGTANGIFRTGYHLLENIQDHEIFP